MFTQKTVQKQIGKRGNTQQQSKDVTNIQRRNAASVRGRPLITLRMVGEGGVSTKRKDGVTWGGGFGTP